jgi:hypothetical protein
MANQAIALQARAPQQGNFLAPAIQQAGQMANRMAQQQALDRQTAVAQQQMDLAQTKEQRDITQSQIDNDGKKIDFYTKRAGQTMNAAGYELLLRDMKKDSPAFEAAFRANLPPERFDRNELLKMVGSVSDNFKATYGPLETQVVQLNNGDFAVTVTGGFGKPGVFEIPEYKLRPGNAPPATPTPPPPAAGVQPMAAPQTPTGGMFQPISATGGQPQSADPQAALLASLTEADKTKQISADVVEQLRQLDPRAAPAVDQFLAQRNIQVSPSGGMRSAVYRPDGNAMAPQQVQFDPDAYVATGRAGRGKPPMQSPMPGSAMVPLGRVAAEARAGRQTPEEAYALELAKARAARDIGPKPLTPVQDAKLRGAISKDFNAAQTTLDAMLNPVSGVMAAAEAVRNLSPEQKEAVTGYSGYVPSVTDSSKTADTKVKNLLGKVTELGKAQASMSGAIGAMAVQEWTIVRNMIANLDVNGMSARDLDDQIDIIVSAAQGAANRVRDQYLNQYAEEFDRYPKRFQLKDPQAAAKPAAGAGKIPRYNPASRSFE